MTCPLAGAKEGRSIPHKHKSQSLLDLPFQSLGGSTPVSTNTIQLEQQLQTFQTEEMSPAFEYLLLAGSIRQAEVLVDYESSRTPGAARDFSIMYTVAHVCSLRPQGLGPARCSLGANMLDYKWVVLF